jgi:hypothetical protein
MGEREDAWNAVQEAKAELDEVWARRSERPVTSEELQDAIDKLNAALRRLSDGY